MVRFLTFWPGAGLVLLTLSAAMATPAVAGDPGKGRAVFASQCGICHANTRDTVILGPPLYGVMGRKAGSIAGFAYSSTMRTAGFTWTADRLRAYLPAPRDYLPGVRMTYAGLKNPSQLDDLIAYLSTLK